MEGLKETKEVTLQNQIDYLKDLREMIDGGHEVNILALPQESIMLRKIHENLIGVKLWNMLDPKDQGEAVKELALALEKAFQLIKQWYKAYNSNKGGTTEDSDLSFERYMLEPDMKLISEVMTRYCKPSGYVIPKDAHVASVESESFPEFPAKKPEAIQKPCNDCMREEAING